jgi:hypothetical protein
MKMFKPLSISLVLMAATVGCGKPSQQTASTVNAILAMVESGADYVAAVSNHTASVPQINEACSLVSTGFNNWASNPNATTLANLQSEVTTFQTQLTAIFTSFGITDAHTQALVTLTLGEVAALLQLVPVANAPPSTMMRQWQDSRDAGLLLPSEFRMTFNALAGTRAIA